MSNQNQSRAVALTKEQLVTEIVLAKPTIEKMLPKHLTFEKFEGTVVNVVAGNPKLMECHQGSLLRAVINAADVGLSLNPIMREADILPVWSSNGSVAQFRPRAIGMMKLARQSGQVIKISAHEVYDDDIFEYEFGMDEKLVHKPSREPKPDRKITHGYCIWQLKDGTKQFEVIDRARIDKSRGSSEGYKYALQNNKTNSVWHLHEGEMVRKTAIRAASKYMPMSTENDPFLRALEYDRDDENVIDGTFTDAPGADGDGAAAIPQSGATQTAALEAKLGVGGAAPAGESAATTPKTPSPNPNQQQTPGQTTAPAAAASTAPTASNASPQPSDTSSQGSGQSGGATTASRSRKKPPAQAAGEQDGPLGDNPPPPEDDGSSASATAAQGAPKPGAPMQDMPGDNWDDEPPKVVVDYAVEARKFRASVLDIGVDWDKWKKLLEFSKPMRDAMKKEAPDWAKKVDDLIVRQEAYMRANAGG